MPSVYVIRARASVLDGSGKPLSGLSETVNSYAVSTGYASTTVHLANDIAMNTTWPIMGRCW